MLNTDLKDFYGRYISGLNARDWATVGTLIADDVHVNGTAYKREDVIASLEGITDAVPDFHWTVEDLFTDKNRIAARLQDTGIPVKPFLGHEPTGGALNIMEYGSYRVENGLFVDMWFLIDATTAGEQLRSRATFQRFDKAAADVHRDPVA
jgi:predicted ester cyclase